VQFFLSWGISRLTGCFLLGHEKTARPQVDSRVRLRTLEEARKKAEAARKEAEAARKAAEAESAKLRREIEALRRRGRK
jgi:hypothetical protein